MARNGKPVAGIALATTSLTHGDALAVAERATALARRVEVAEHRRVDDAEHGLTVDHQPDRHADRREAVHEVGGAVERIGEPPDVGALAALLLAEERDLRRRPLERGADRALAGDVGVAHEIAGMLLADVLRRGEAVAHDRARGDRGVDRDGEQVVEVEAHGHDSTARSADEQLGRARGHRLAASDGIGDDELAVARVGDVARRSRGTRAGHRGSPTGSARRSVQSRNPSSPPAATSQSASAAEPSDRNWRHARLVRRHADDRDHGPVHLGDLRRGGGARRRATRPFRAPRCSEPRWRRSRRTRTAGRRHRARTARCPSTGCRVQQFVDPSTGSTTTVISASSLAAPRRLLAQDPDRQGVEDGEDRGVGDRVEVVLARPVGARPPLDPGEPGERLALRVGGGGEGREQVVGRHSGSTVTMAL